MKKRFLKPIAAWAVVSAMMFSCAGTNEVSDAGLEPTNVTVTETEVAAGTTPSGNTVVVADTDLVKDTTVMMPERQAMSNRDIDYGDMFDDIDDTEQYNVYQLITMNPELSTFAELLKLSGLAPSLTTVEAVTLFVPTNEAFNQVPQERLAKLIDPNNRAMLIEFINMHVLPSEVSTLSLENDSFIDRGEEEDIPVNVEMAGTVFYVGGAQIIVPDVEASNGMIHVVNNVVKTSEQAGADLD